MLSRVDALLQRFLAFATAAALTVMLVVVLIVTVLRYGFHIGIFWGEELSRYAMIYMVFLGAAIGFRHNQHPRLGMVLDRLPLPALRILRLVIALILVATLAVVLYTGIDVALHEGRLRTIGLQIPYFWVLIIIPIGAGLMITQIVAGLTFPSILDSLFRDTDHGAAE